MNTIQDITEHLKSLHDGTIIASIVEYENYANFVDAEPLCAKLLQDIEKLVEHINTNIIKG